jgi:hypothetical protein
MNPSSDLVVRATIWLALALFVAGEAGRRRARRSGSVEAWALPSFAAGALLCAAHFAAVFHWHHGWSHADAVAATARQTGQVFGLAWGGGVWFNYLFLTLWVGDVVAWARHPASALRPPDRTTWFRRGFYFVIIVNAAVVFASWPMNLPGLVLCTALAWCWRR